MDVALTPDILFVFGMVILAMFFFAAERVPYDLVAMVIMVSLMLAGILDVREGFSGFANPATAALLASLAIETAAGMGVEPRPFLMAITFAASLSLTTPWGYQTNTLIYGPGRFRFSDYTRVGAPLNVLFWILGSIFIPLFWNF